MATFSSELDRIQIPTGRSTSTYVYIYNNGDVYEGHFNERNERNGQGVYHYGNGDVYNGEWKHDERHGYGKYSFDENQRQ